MWTIMDNLLDLQMIITWTFTFSVLFSFIIKYQFNKLNANKSNLCVVYVWNTEIDSINEYIFVLWCNIELSGKWSLI